MADMHPLDDPEKKAKVVGLLLKLSPIALAASVCLVGVKQRWRLHWAAAGAARV